MNCIYTLGETVLDIVFKNDVPVAAKAGGSMLNASVTLGRLKKPVSFISELGTDRVGEMIKNFLESNGVDTQFIYRFDEGKSAVALAFLDEHQNADYSFYKIYPPKRLQIDVPLIKQGDLVMFGSYFGIAPAVRSAVLRIISEARKKGAIILYDPNFRKAHLDQLPELKPVIDENIALSDIIKGSDEDFMNIFQTASAPETFRKLNDNTKILIYSKGKNGVEFFSNMLQFHVAAKNLVPVSTIGAGDNFNAGIAYGLMHNSVYRDHLTNLPQHLWNNILQYGVDFASEVCLSYENYISETFASEFIAASGNE